MEKLKLEAAQNLHKEITNAVKESKDEMEQRHTTIINEKKDDYKKLSAEYKALAINLTNIEH